MSKTEKNTDKEKSVLRWAASNLLGAAAFFLGLSIVASLVLGVFTRHGKEIEVPDMTNLTVEQAAGMAAGCGIRTEVTDSVYVRRMAKGAVYRQNPEAGSKVKKGRRIMLTINAVNAKKVSMPDLAGLSMRQARAELSSKGLNLSNLIYVDDIATNNVLKQLYRNREIPAGTEIESGSDISLVVGLNPENNQTFVPDVVGLRYTRAVDALHDNSLNIGRLVFDKNVRTYSDSLNAVVSSQSPGVSEFPILMGSEVALRLSLSEEQ